MNQHDTASSSPPGWFPDPGRTHELRYFDGSVWTDHVSDHGQVSHAPAAPAVPPVRVPRGKMWTLAILSCFVFYVNTPSSRTVLPLGIIFAIWCWRLTAEPLKARAHAGSSAVTEIKAARIVAVCLALVSLAQVALWAH